MRGSDLSVQVSEEGAGEKLVFHFTRRPLTGPAPLLGIVLVIELPLLSLHSLQAPPGRHLRGGHSLPGRLPGPGHRGRGAHHLHGEGLGEQVPGGD